MVGTSGRLAIFVPSMRLGGAERATVKLARGMEELGYAIDLVLARAEGPHMDEIPESMSVVDLGASRVLASLPGLVRYLRRVRPRAMLSVMCNANIVALWARRLARVPERVVVSERNVLSIAAQSAPNYRGRLMPRLARHCYPWADRIVTVSKGVADDLARTTRLPRARIQVIYNPIVTPELRKRVRAPLVHPWFVRGEPPVILGVGRLEAQKDFATLIDAFALVRRVRLARLLILGEGTERARLEAQIKRLGLIEDVSLPGFVANPYPYMMRAWLFALSSRWEGLPGVLIEALYCGVRLVATDCPGGSREILRGGEYGRLVPVDDVVALADAIGASLQDPAPRRTPESWLPFELERVVHQYLGALLDDSALVADLEEGQ